MTKFHHDMRYARARTNGRDTLRPPKLSEIYAIPQPYRKLDEACRKWFDVVQPALRGPDHWALASSIEIGGAENSRSSGMQLRRPRKTQIR